MTGNDEPLTNLTATRHARNHGPYLIGIGGGSGSGKTVVATSVINALGADHVLLVEEDSYYKDLSYLSPEERQLVNFDHPSAFDHDLLREHVHALMAGKAVQMPEYDYSHHARTGKLTEIHPREVILLDGILIFVNQQLRDLMDLRVYVDADSGIRLARRIRRDMAERGRTLESVLKQYETQVQPMHEQFVAPFKSCADLIIPGGGRVSVAVDMLVTTVRALLRMR